MNWNTIETESELEAAIAESKVRPVMLFKHSTTCVISITAKARLERKWKDVDSQIVKPFYIDLKRFRSVSNRVAELTGVQHESPQAIVLQNGQVIHQATHSAIFYDDLLAAPKRA